jgi:AhpD family alkylhydroperoxidase
VIYVPEPSVSHNAFRHRAPKLKNKLEIQSQEIIMAITVKERELAAVGISVASGCKPCTNYHVKAVREAGASDEEIKRAVTDSLSVRKSATYFMKTHALARLGQEGSHSDADGPDSTNRVRELISVGAAFGVNCTSNLKQHLAAAATVGISQEEITEIAKLAAFIKERAASHVDRLVRAPEEEGQATAQRRSEAEVGNGSV